MLSSDFDNSLSRLATRLCGMIMLYYYFQHWAQKFNTIFSFPKVVMSHSLNMPSVELPLARIHLELIAYAKNDGGKDPSISCFARDTPQIMAPIIGKSEIDEMSGDLILTNNILLQ